MNTLWRGRIWNQKWVPSILILPTIALALHWIQWLLTLLFPEPRSFLWRSMLAFKLNQTRCQWEEEADGWEIMHLCRDSSSTQKWLPHQECHSILRKSQVNLKIPTSTSNSFIQETMSLQGSKIRSTTGFWIPSIDSISHSYPQYIFPLDSPHNNTFSMNHSFYFYYFTFNGLKILHLCFSWFRSYKFSYIKLFCIQIFFASITVTNFCTNNCSRQMTFMFWTFDSQKFFYIEYFRPYQVYPFGYCPIILGLDWLQRYNLDIDWKEGKLTCCNIYISSFQCLNNQNRPSS